jgi:hypothetical protein
MAPFSGIVAHGGVAGAIAESFVAIAVVGVFVAIWLRERSARKEETRAEVTKPDG